MAEPAEPAAWQLPEPTAVDGGGAVAPRNVPLDPGQVVGEEDGGGWRVLRHIAEGGFSSVYAVAPASAATAVRHGAGVRALKCLWGTPAELTTIGGEAAKMAAVSGHENVLGLVASFRFDLPGGPYGHHVGLVLELAAEDLPTFARRVRPGEQAWAAVFEQVAAGLEHIHSRRVVHGDIKPTNILRVGARFAVADFGVSAPLETTRSAGIGWARTIAFWPPESASQGELDSDGVRRPPVEGWRATQAGDVWALAVTMHRVLTGRHITPGTTPEQQYELVCLGRYSIDDRLGEGWRRLFTDCLVHEPEHRVVTTAAELRRRLAELALPDDYAGVPWTDRAPRLVALLDLAAEPPPAEPPVAQTPVAETPVAGPPVAEPANAEPASVGAANAGAVVGSAVAEPAVLVLTMTAEGGRVSGLLVRDRLLLSAARHLTEDVVPCLAQQVRDSQRALVRLADEQERLRGLAASSVSPEEEAARTEVVQAVEIEHTRQLSVAVADVTRQRDRLVADRDRLTRHRDELAEERDRLRRDYGDLARRLERLERGQLPPRYSSSEETLVIPAQRPPSARNVSLSPANGWSPTPASVLPWPDRTKVIQPAQPAQPAPPAVAEVPRRLGPAADDVAPIPARARPVVTPARPRRRGPVRWLARLLRRLMVTIVLLVVVAVLAVAVTAKLIGQDPASLLHQGTSQVLDRVTADR